MIGLKGTITADGYLTIIRPRNHQEEGTPTFATCPYKFSLCSDTCVKFGNPYQDGQFMILPICDSHVLQFCELIDERVMVIE